MKRLPLLVCAVMVLGFATPSFAQNAAATAAAAPDIERRIELARKMHEVRPMVVPIEEAVEQLAQRYPKEKRELFISTMLNTFDRESLTEISVKAMAETFTAAELEKMIEFNSSPEGKAITEKMPVYQSLVEPELMKKVDKALMEVRMGKTGN